MMIITTITNKKKRINNVSNRFDVVPIALELQALLFDIFIDKAIRIAVEYIRVDDASSRNTPAVNGML